MPKQDLLSAFAKIEGVYVPSLYEVSYDESGAVKEFKPKVKDAPTKIIKRFVKDLDAAFFPVEWLLPYLNGKQKHGEFVNSTVSFDKKRAANGEKDYVAGTLFNPKNGVGTLELAEYFYPDAINLIDKLKNTDQNYPDWQLVLNHIKR